MPLKRFHLGIVLTVVLATSLAFAWWLYFGPASSSSSEDPLCKMVSARYAMSCVPLATPKMYDRGAIIRRPDGAKQAPTTALPEDHLFSSACVFSPDAVQSVSFREDREVSLDFGKHKYTVDRNASVGVDLKLPKVAGLTFKAGPKISHLREVVLEAESARYFNIDSQAFLTSLKSCAIRPACIARARNTSSDIVKRFIIARNLKYTVNLTSGGSESLSGAIKTGEIKIEADAKRADTSVDDLSSGEDMVIGVSYFDRREIQGVDACSSPISVLKATGDTKLYAKVGTPGEPAKELESPSDHDIMVSDFGRDAPDRKSNESMIPGEARAFGGWFFHNDSEELEFHLRNVAIPGIRYPNITDDDARNRGFAVIYTNAHSYIVSTAELTVANRTEETKGLFAIIHYSVASTPDKLISAYAWLDPLAVIRADGTERTPAAVWSGHTQEKEFPLGNIGPGEVVKIRMGRKLESTSSAADIGTIEESTRIKFELRSPENR